tara:strand:- start:26 stop:178 length:153 start_codon:yes stop_codon:yes gene_type:complete
MKMPKRNNKKRVPIDKSRPKITPKMRETIKKMGRKKNKMTAMERKAKSKY